MSNKRVLVPIADGSEELEAVSIIDTLVRAGAKVTVAKVGGDKKILTVVASRNTILGANVHLLDVLNEEFDLIALPGGLEGAKTFANTPELINMLKKQKENNKLYAAICASPALVFAPHGLLEGKKKATCYPQMQDQLPKHLDKEAMNQRVVVDGNCITSQGPCTAVEFAIELAALLFGEEKAKSVAKGMLLK